MDNIFLYISERGECHGFEPQRETEPTNSAPGTPEKLRDIAYRAENGMPLFHSEDRNDYEGFRGGVTPKR